MVDAVLYFVDNGCKWRNLPHDFPPYTTVSNFYYATIRSGLWEKICAALVERVRTDSGRNADPSCAIIDSQSVKSASTAEERGIDGGKIKRTQTAHRGNLLAVTVHATNIHDTKSGILVARDAFEKYPSIQRFCADAGYRKTFEQDVSRELVLRQVSK